MFLHTIRAIDLQTVSITCMFKGTLLWYTYPLSFARKLVFFLKCIFSDTNFFKIIFVY